MPNSDPSRVMSPLNFIVKLKPGSKAGIEMISPQLSARLKRGADQIGTLHEARFVRLDEDTIGLFTTYDGDFDTYISDFTKHIADIFNALFANVVDPPPLPVEKNIQAFADYVRAHDFPIITYYTAYPNLTVQDIRALSTARV